MFGGLLVDLGEGKPNVDNGIVADFDLGDVVEANVLDDAAEVDPTDADETVGSDFFYFSWNG